MASYFGPSKRHWIFSSSVNNELEVVKASLPRSDTLIGQLAHSIYSIPLETSSSSTKTKTVTTTNNLASRAFFPTLYRYDNIGEASVEASGDDGNGDDERRREGLSVRPRWVYFLEVKRDTFAGPFINEWPLSITSDDAQRYLGEWDLTTLLPEPRLRLIPQTLLREDSPTIYASSLLTAATTSYGLPNIVTPTFTMATAAATAITAPVAEMREESILLLRRDSFAMPRRLAALKRHAVTLWKIRANPPIAEYLEARNVPIKLYMYKERFVLFKNSMQFVDLLEEAAFSPSPTHYWCLEIKWDPSNPFIALCYLRGVAEVTTTNEQRVVRYPWLPGLSKGGNGERQDPQFILLNPLMFLSLTGAELWQDGVDPILSETGFAYPNKFKLEWNQSAINFNRVVDLAMSTVANEERLDRLYDAAVAPILLQEHEALNADVQRIVNEFLTTYHQYGLNEDRIKYLQRTISRVQQRIEENRASVYTFLSQRRHRMFALAEDGNDRLPRESGESVLELLIQQERLLANQRSSLTRQSSRVKEGSSALREQVERLRQQVKSQSKFEDKLLSQLDTYRQTITKLQSQQEEDAQVSEDAIELLKHSIEDLETKLKRSQAARNAERIYLQEEHARLLQEQTRQAGLDIEKLKQSSEEASKMQMDRFKTEIDKLQLEKRKLKESIRATAQEFEASMKRINDENRERLVALHKDTVERHQKALKENREITERLQASLIRQVRMMLRPFKESLIDPSPNLLRIWSNDNATLPSLLLLADQLFQRLNSELEEAKRDNNALRLQLQSMRVQLYTQEQRLQQYQRELKEAQDALAPTKQRVNEQEVLITQLRDRVSDQRSELRRMTPKYIAWAKTSLFPRDVSLDAKAIVPDTTLATSSPLTPTSAYPFIFTPQRFGLTVRAQRPPLQSQQRSYAKKWITFYEYNVDDRNSIFGGSSSSQRSGRVREFIKRVLTNSERVILQINVNARLGLPIYYKVNGDFVEANKGGVLTEEVQRRYFHDQTTPFSVKDAEEEEEAGTSIIPTRGEGDDVIPLLGRKSWKVVELTEDDEQTIRPVIIAWRGHVSKKGDDEREDEEAERNGLFINHLLKPQGYFSCLDNRQHYRPGTMVPLIGYIKFEDFDPYGSGGVLFYDLSNDHEIDIHVAYPRIIHFTGYLPTARVVLHFKQAHRDDEQMELIRILLEPFSHLDTDTDTDEEYSSGNDDDDESGDSSSSSSSSDTEEFKDIEDDDDE